MGVTEVQKLRAEILSLKEERKLECESQFGTTPAWLEYSEAWGT